MSKKDKQKILSLVLSIFLTSILIISKEFGFNETDPDIVVRVIDGDTIEMGDGRKVRYIGINAPEIDTKDCFSKEAKYKNIELVENKKVTLVKDVSETDKYGRLLRYVYVEDKFINKVLVKEGFALAKKYEPDTTLASELKQAEDTAKMKMNGIWKYCSY